MIDNDGAKRQAMAEYTKQERLKPQWQELLTTLRNREAQPIDAEALQPSPDAKFFRGTSIADIAYAIIENQGNIVSPLSQQHVNESGEWEERLGTIITDDIVEAGDYANNQLVIKETLQKKQQWLASVLHMSEQEVMEIQGLWQPILLEFTRHIPHATVEDAWGEIWTDYPINVFEQSLTEKTIHELEERGIQVRDKQRVSTFTWGEREIELIKEESRQKVQELMGDEYEQEETETPEEILSRLKREEIFAKMRSEVGTGKFFAQYDDLAGEDDEPTAEAALEAFYAKLVKEIDEVRAQRGISEVDPEKLALASAIEPFSDTLDVLMRYWGIDEAMPWSEAANTIIDRQSFNNPNFPSPTDIARVTGQDM